MGITHSPGTNETRRGQTHLSNADVVLLDGIGHTPHLSQPAYVGERLAAWIRDTTPERAAGGRRGFIEVFPYR